MVKNIIALFLGAFISLGFLNGYQWHCGELALLSNFNECVLSICTLIYIVNSMIVVGIFKSLTNYSKKTIIMVSLIFIFFGMIIFLLNNGFIIEHILNIFLAHIGMFIGLVLSFVYFKKFKNIKNGLLLLVIMWMLVNIVYPMIS